MDDVDAYVRRVVLNTFRSRRRCDWNKEQPTGDLTDVHSTPLEADDDQVALLPGEIPSTDRYEADRRAEGRAFEAADASCNAVAKAQAGTMSIAAPAARCSVNRKDGAIWTSLTATGAATIVYDKTHKRGGLFERLGG